LSRITYIALFFFPRVSGH